MPLGHEVAGKWFLWLTFGKGWIEFCVVAGGLPALECRQTGRSGPIGGVGASVAFVLTILLGSLALSPPAAAAGPVPAETIEDVVKVKVEQGLGLRGIAEKFLKDPDLWPIILRLNGIENVADIREGQELLLPASQVRLAATALDASLAEIQKANEAGAQIFAPIMIKNAIDFRDMAVIENRNGVYVEAIALSSKSIVSAGEARTTSEQKRDVEAEARLSDRQGWVEGQKTSENGWTERELNAVLNEQEKLRTLSESTAQVVFRDASRLRLNSNSQAVIQRMRDDPLKRRKEAQISLVEGDFYALLAPESDRSRLEVNLANVDAKVDSGSFWVSQDDSGAAKFSNYDSKPVAIVSGGDTLVLGRNEGAVVQGGETPTEKVAVMGRPSLSQPADNATVFGNSVRLSWEPIEGGAGYWVEIGFDARFDRMVDSLWDIKEEHTGDLTLAPGTYYWRVATLDSLGLPGPMSTARKFEIISDQTPPFLRIRTPDSNSIVREASVTISGETEAGVAVTVAGEVASVDKDGRFFFTVESKDGDNQVTVIARDAAGNETSRQLQFTYLRDSQRAILYDPSLPRDAEGRFLTAGRQLALSGRAAEGARISVSDADGRLRSETYADQAGHFAIGIPLAGGAEALEIKVTTVSGYAYQETIDALASDRPPQFRLSKPLPPVTSQPTLDLSIEADPGTRLTVNGADGEVSGSTTRFKVELTLGANLVEIVATDAVGLVTIKKHTVVFDNEKPEVTGKEIIAKRVGDSDMLSIRVGAADASGLAQTSRFRIRSGDAERAGVLRYNRASKSYQGSIEMPVAPADGGYEIVVKLTDVAGNVNEVRLQ